MDRNIKLLAAFNFFTDFKLYSAVLIIYFVKITGSYTLAMALLSITMASSAFFEVPTGVYSDIIGRKKTVVVGSLFALSSVVLYALGINFFVLAIGAFFEGVSRAFYSGNNTALLYNSMDASGKKDTFVQMLGKTSAMFQAALALGAFLGSILASKSFHIIMWASVVPQIVCFILSLYIKEPPGKIEKTPNLFMHVKKSIILIYQNKILRYVSLQDILSFGINEATFQFRSAFIATIWPLWAIGLSSLLSYVGAAISFWTSGKIIKKFGEGTVILYPRIYARIIGIIAYAFPTIISPILLSSTSLFYGTISVATDSLTQKHVTENLRATTSSTVSLMGSLFFTIFSVALGGLADLTKPSTALLSAEICSVAIIYFCYKLLKETQKRV